jgi:PIN domain nuclease of toxin-antitoxin system
VIVLDTHVLLWRALEPDRVSEEAKEAILLEESRAVSTVTFQEVAYLVARGRVELDKPPGRWLGDALGAIEGVAISPSTSIALRAGSLNPRSFRGDPMDRLIYATALEHDARLVTADERLRQFDPERTVW